MQILPAKFVFIHFSSFYFSPFIFSLIQINNWNSNIFIIEFFNIFYCYQSKQHKSLLNFSSFSIIFNLFLNIFVPGFCPDTLDNPSSRIRTWPDPWPSSSISSWGGLLCMASSPAPSDCRPRRNPYETFLTSTIRGSVQRDLVPCYCLETNQVKWNRPCPRHQKDRGSSFGSVHGISPKVTSQTTPCSGPLLSPPVKDEGLMHFRYVHCSYYPPNSCQS